MPINEEQKEISERELEQMRYEDMLVMFNSYLEQYGVRRVMVDFRNSFPPTMFQELVVQINRIAQEARRPMLLR